MIANMRKRTHVVLVPVQRATGNLYLVQPERVGGALEDFRAAVRRTNSKLVDTRWGLGLPRLP
jgi:hypothetical protein